MSINGGKPVVNSKTDKPETALVEAETFERPPNPDEKFERLRVEMSKAFTDWSRDEVRAVVDEAVQAARGLLPRR